MKLAHIPMALALSILLPALADAGPITISAFTSQSNHSGFGGSSFPLTGGGGWNFSGSGYNTLGSISEISVTLTMHDGDTSPGDFDFGNLTLALDGIDTGLSLDGFTDDAVDPSQPITLTLSGVPNNAAAILAALQADGLLVGTINDATPGDNALNLFSKYNTTLTITGQQVPEPATLLLLGGGVGLVVAFGRRFRLSA